MPSKRENGDTVLAVQFIRKTVLTTLHQQEGGEIQL